MSAALAETELFELSKRVGFLRARSDFLKNGYFSNAYPIESAEFAGYEDFARPIQERINRVARRN